MSSPIFQTKTQSHAWQSQMRKRIQSLKQLLQYKPELKDHPLIKEAISTTELQKAKLRMSLTPYYASLIDAKNPNCPILKQSLPTKAELKGRLFFEKDPLAEESHMPTPGLTHRYPDRVLWYLTHSCAVYCRYCLRRRKVSDPTSNPNTESQQKALSYIQNNPKIKEVILSGGDPLSLSDKRVSHILSELKQIPHLKSIRIHSRMPVTLPQRITERLARILEKHYPLTFVTHFNHPIELTDEAKKAVRRLRMAGVAVLNQSVLLQGINDRLLILENLLSDLLKAGVLPYYLHRCDEIPGTEHFQTPLLAGKSLLQQLRGKNPGIALPRYMIDLPGGGGKVPFEENYYLGTPDSKQTQTPNVSKVSFENSFEISKKTPSPASQRHLFRNHEGRIFEVRDISNT